MTRSPLLSPGESHDLFDEGTDPLTLGQQGTAMLDEAVLRALEESRPKGYVSSILLSQIIGWDTEGMPSPNGDGYGRVAVLGLLYRLYLEGRVEPAHPPNGRGHWGGWRITDEEYVRRRGEDDVNLTVPDVLEFPASTLSGWVSLNDYPLPPKTGPMPAVPSIIRFPDETENEPKQWNEVLPLVVEWLNRKNLLTPERNVPVRMSRGRGYLVNTEPFHSDGRPMEARVQAGGPDRLWIHTKSSASPGHYGTYHARRLVQYCGQSLENVQLWLGDPVPEDDRADDAQPVSGPMEPSSTAEDSANDDDENLVPPPWDLSPRRQERWRAVQQAKAEGLSQRAIAHRLGITRNTVRRYVRAAESL